MKNLFFTAFLSFLVMSASAQWVQLNSTTTNHLRSVHFVDGYTGYAAGVSGTILKTTDKGNNWSSLASGTTATLIRVHFPEDEDTGFVIGNSGLARKTTDAGASWSGLTSGTTNNLRGLYFLNNDTGYFCGQGGTIGKTVNSGSSWSTQSINAYYMRDLDFTSIDTGYVCGDDGSIYKTVDGGSSWTAQSTGTSENLQAINFPAKDTGYSAGVNGTLLKTTDGGNNWSLITVPTTEILRVFFITSQKGYIIGNSGSIYYTSDGGNNWLSESSGVTDALIWIHFPNSDIGYIAGENGVLLKTEINTAIADIMTGETIKIFPNPSNGRVTIKTPDNYSVESVKMVNLTGQVVLLSNNDENSNMYNIDTNTYSKGLYLLQINSGGTIIHKRLILN